MQRHPRYTRDRIAQVGERIRALIWADARDPDVLRVAGPVDRIPPDEAERLEYRDASLGDTFGPLWATFWFQVGATVPDAVGRPARRPAVDQPQRGHAVDRRALRPGPEHQPDGRADRCAGAGVGGRRRAARPAGRAGLQRQVRQARPAVRLARAGGARPLPDRPLRPRGVGAAPRLRRAPPAGGGRRERARRVVGGPAAGRAERGLQRLVGGRPGELGALAGDPRRAAGPPQRLARAPPVGDRPRAPGHGLAVAVGRDLPQGRPHVQLADGVHGALPGVPVRLLAGPAVRLDPRAQPRPLRADPPPGRGRALGAGRRHVDRAGLQPAVGRVARPPVSVRTTVLRAGVRPPLQRVLEPRRVRLQRPAAADHARRRDRPVPDPEAVLEPLQPAAVPHVHLAGDRRLAGARALPAGRHVQRHGRDRRAAPHRARVQGPRPLRPQPAGVRLGRRRRRADAGDAGDAAPGGRPAGRAAHGDDDQRRVLRRAGGRRRASWRRSSASCTSSTTAAPTRPRPLSRRATGQASGRCTTPSSCGRWPAASTRASGWPSSGSCCS